VTGLPVSSVEWLEIFILIFILKCAKLQNCEIKIINLRRETERVTCGKERRMFLTEFEFNPR
jgi:hypothetical protein